MERRQREVYSKANRKPTPHKKTRKKRGIPVAPPRIPSFEGPPPPLPPFPGGQRIVTAQSLDPLDKGIFFIPRHYFTFGTAWFMLENYTMHAVKVLKITFCEINAFILVLAYFSFTNTSFTLVHIISSIPPFIFFFLVVLIFYLKKIFSSAFTCMENHILQAFLFYWLLY